MTYKVSPYISFREGAAEALEFYRSVLGGEVSAMKTGDIPDPELAEADGTAGRRAGLTRAGCMSPERRTCGATGIPGH